MNRGKENTPAESEREINLKSDGRTLDEMYPEIFRKMNE